MPEDSFLETSFGVAADRAVADPAEGEPGCAGGSWAHTMCCEFSEGCSAVAGGTQTFWVTPTVARKPERGRGETPSHGTKARPHAERLGSPQGGPGCEGTRPQLDVGAAAAPRPGSSGPGVSCSARLRASGTKAESHVPQSLPSRTNLPSQPGSHPTPPPRPPAGLSHPPHAGS